MVPTSRVIGGWPDPATWVGHPRCFRLVRDAVRCSRATKRLAAVLGPSPGHPLVDGRILADLMPGDRYDGAVVMSTTLAPYAGASWDLLPSGPTGAYFANGVLLASSLRNSPAPFPGIEPLCREALIARNSVVAILGRGRAHDLQVTWGRGFESFRPSFPR